MHHEEPPFDSRWLELLSQTCATGGRQGPALEDIYLERRLEVRVGDDGPGTQMELCSSEGCAARWRLADRDVLQATTGTSPRAVCELFSGRRSPGRLAVARPVPPPEMDAPRGWCEWAAELVSRMTSLRPEIHYLARRAVVVGADGWRTVRTPALVRIRTRGDDVTALLAVWNHSELNLWLRELRVPQPPKRWRPPSGTDLPVLFTGGTAGGLIHELLGHLTESDLAAAGDSPFAELAGATLTAATLNLVDDPTRFDLPGAFDHDDEGVRAQPVTLVENGRLTGWLCDRRGGEALAQPPGRGRRAGWKHAPVPRLSNLITAPGTAHPQDMEKDLRRGLVVTRLGGATVDPVSSRTVLRVERGWEIRNGRRRRPLDAFELTGKVLQILTSVDPEIGSDTTTDWRLGWCVKGGAPMPTGSVAPSLLVRRLEVL